MPIPLKWKIDECSVYFGRLHVRGWCHVAGTTIQSVELRFKETEVARSLHSYGIPSADVAKAVDPSAERCRFDEWLEIPTETLGRDFSLRVRLADGSEVLTGSAHQNANEGDPYHVSWVRFLQLLNDIPAGAVLEIGSRARSGVIRRNSIPSRLEYVGLDILPGPNVDVVGDAHSLEKLFGRDRFVAAFSCSVFEHLAMPWKVAIELNRVMKTGGIIFTQTHQTWPVHEEPWDFWRYSAYAWQTLFNQATGFEVLIAASGEPASIYALRANPVTSDLPGQPAYLGSAAIVRKTSDTNLTWPVPTEIAATGLYPKGETIVRLQ